MTWGTARAGDLAQCLPQVGDGAEIGLADRYHDQSVGVGTGHIDEQRRGARLVVRRVG